MLQRNWNSFGLRYYYDPSMLRCFLFKTIFNSEHMRPMKKNVYKLMTRAC
ncbi:MAG: hypothetical protein ACI8QQ_001557 [Psychroserpens sp.]